MNISNLTKKLPMVLGIITFLAIGFYQCFLAADRYTSESRFTIKSSGTGAAPAGLDLGLLGGSSATKQDQLVIRDYLKSHDMMQKVIEEFGLEAISGPSSDILWSVDENSNTKSLLNHFRSLIEFTYDEEASVSTLVTQGFDPDIAQALNGFLIVNAEEYINKFSDKSSNSFINFAEEDVLQSKKAVNEANSKIRSAQEAGQLVDPTTDIQVVAKTLTELEAQLATVTAEMSELQGVYQEGTYQLTSKQMQIENIEDQISRLRARMASGEGEDLAGASVLFAALQFELEFANASYASALKTLEMAKVQAMQSRKYLVIIDSPDVADFALYPKVFLNLMVAAALILASIVVFKGVAAIIKEY
jgi:capsular polysaccharide transport system permease protein